MIEAMQTIVELIIWLVVCVALLYALEWLINDRSEREQRRDEADKKPSKHEATTRRTQSK